MQRYYSVTGHYEPDNNFSISNGFRSVYLEGLSEADALVRGKEQLRKNYPTIKFTRYIVRDES